MSEAKLTVEIHFGALAPTISEQLQKQGLKLPGTLAQQFQNDAEAISRLRISGILTNGEARKAESRVFKAISRKARAVSPGRQKENKCTI